jgi:hypothetical protein
MVRSQIIVQNRYQGFTVSEDEFTASRVCITEDRTRIVLIVHSATVRRQIYSDKLTQPVVVPDVEKYFLREPANL